VVLGVCSSTDESLLESLLSLHTDATTPTPSKSADKARAAVKPTKGRKRS
jgi:hypothetical protein